jgi:uncharacterized protein with FMN-binding domain
MNLNAGKAVRARLGFAGLLGTVALVVVGRSVAGGHSSADSGSALTMPGGSAQGANSLTVASPTASATAAASASATASVAATAPVAVATTPAVSNVKRTVVGDPENTRYGPVQVELVLQGTKILDVVALEVPNQERRDIEINNQAVPILRQEVLAAQSAKIDTVSGASFTSSGYAWSVQSALDKAGIKR